MSSIHDQLGGFDVNQLLALDVLLELRSVTKAARRMGVTQSAMSHTLRRLRGDLNDELLVRAGAGMLPTPYAEGLAPELRAALSRLAHAVRPPPAFDPATSERVFALASPDLFDAVVLPTLLATLAEEGPKLGVAMQPGLRDLGWRLETGELDFAVVPSLSGGSTLTPSDDGLDADLRRTRLFEDSFTPYVRCGHPAVGKRLSAKAFAAMDHVLVAPTGSGDGITDTALEERGLSRRISVRVPSFLAAVAVVRATDMVMVAPGALIHIDSGLSPLKVALKLPKHGLHLVWHPRFDAEPGRRWLRARLQTATARLAAKLV